MLREAVRALLAGGVLRRIDGHATAGRGSGRGCAVCGDPVTPQDVEYEVEGPRETRAASHLRCFLVWRDESKKIAPKG
jgi:hypothetical protein